MATKTPAETANSPSLATVLRSSGPVVTCVLLDTTSEAAEEDAKQPPTPEAPTVLADLIREIQVDTTPSKNGVETALGGPFTFLGQFPDEGCVVMGRRPPPDYRACSLSDLRKYCRESQIDTTGMVEKLELIEALEENASMQPNPHVLPPPLHKVKDIRGPILLLRVAGSSEDEEEVTEEDEEEALERAVSEFQRSSSVSNDEFFLSYSKDEYVKFASRTDHVIPSSSSEGEEEEEDDDEEEEEDEDEEEWDGEDGDEDFDPSEASDDEKKMLMNMILVTVLNKFREENGRGPDSEEVLELRKSVHQKLGMELPSPPLPSSPLPDSRKRAGGDDTNSHRQSKKVKFDESVKTWEYEAECSEEGGEEGGEDNDKKPAADEVTNDKLSSE